MHKTPIDAFWIRKALLSKPIGGIYSVFLLSCSTISLTTVYSICLRNITL
jgi:hypothetical protein